MIPEIDFMRLLILQSLQKPLIIFLFLVIMGFFPAMAQSQSRDFQGNFIKMDGSFATYSGRINVFKKHRYIIVGGSLHFLKYFGDLSASEYIFNANFSMIRPGIGLWAGYKISPGVTLRSEIFYGRLMGEDFSTFSLDDSHTSSLYIRNLSFRNDIVELSFTGKFDIFRNYREYFRRRDFNVYLLAGVAVLYHNPKARAPEFTIDGNRFPEYGSWVPLRPLGTEGQNSEHYDVKPYSNFQFAVPIGGGIEFRLTSRLDFSVEFAYRFLMTDYLDDVSGKYVDLGALDGDMAKAMSDRSREKNSAIKEQPRDMEGIFEHTQLYTYTSRYDGKPYTVLKGYGNEGGTRGGSSYDMYFTTSFKISYILATPFVHGKIK